MPFPERLLGDNEEIIYDLRPHWWTLAGPTLVAFVTLALAIAVGVAVPQGRYQQGARIVLAVAVVVVLIVWVVPRMLTWATTHFVLTTDRLIFRSGVFAKYAREIPLERLNDVTFSQSIWERIIGTGDLLIESAGEHGQSRFVDIRNPEAVQLEIYRQMEANGQRMASGGAPAPAPAPNVLEQIERLANLRDRGVLSDAEFDRKKRELLDRL